MSFYEDMMVSLQEAIDYSKGSKDLHVQTVTITTNCDNKAKYSALEIAKWFIGYNRLKHEDNPEDNITNLKLQKLLYYAQGISLKYTGKPLFDENIEAWQYGPVVPVVYHEYKQYGGMGINKNITMPNFDENTESILKDVYEDYGQYSAWKLRDMTHEESPWKETPRNFVISLSKMYQFFGR